MSRGDPYSQALAPISGYENTTGEPRTDAGGTKKAHDAVSEGRWSRPLAGFRPGARSRPGQPRPQGRVPNCPRWQVKAR